MTEEEKNIKQENFIEWTTFIEDRVDEWSVNVPKKIVDALDYSPESLKVIESYILSPSWRELVARVHKKEEMRYEL